MDIGNYICLETPRRDAIYVETWLKRHQVPKNIADKDLWNMILKTEGRISCVFETVTKQLLSII